MTISCRSRARGFACSNGLSIRGLVAALLVGVCGQAFALDPARQLSQYVLDNWQVPEGLPQVSAQALARTPEGYLWIGTQEGLARFDGVRFTVFDGSNAPAIPNRSIRILFADRTGRLWIGTAAGIAVQENGRFTRFDRVPALEHAYVRAIAEGKDGRFWVGTEDGLFEIGGGRSLSFGASSGLQDGRIRALQEDRDGILWVGTGSGLLRFDGKHFDKVSLGPADAEVSVTAIHEAADGVLWMGTETGALFRRAGDHFDVIAEAGRVGSYIRTLMSDHDGNLWIGTIEGGLVRWRNGQFDALTNDLFTHSDLQALLEDSEGSLWVGSFNVGLLRLRDGKFATVGEPEGLKGSVTLSVAPRKKGGLWVGSSGGVSSYVDGRFQHVSGPPGHENALVLSVLEDRQGALWAGTGLAGLYRLDEHGMTVFNRHNGLSADAVFAIMEDRQGRMWVGTSEGLDVIDHGKVASKLSLLGLSGPAQIHILYEDRAGNLWVSVWRQGVFVIGEHGIRHIGMADGLPSPWVFAIHEDERGDVWLGTLDGLALWRDGKVISLQRFGGPLQETICQLLEDDTHQFWLATTKGLITVSHDALRSLAAGGTRLPEFHVYGLSDGLRSAELFGGNTGAGVPSPDGLMWFPSMRGVVRVDPKHIRMNALPPPVRIEQVLVDGAPLALTEGTEVAPGAKQWEFHYTGLSLLVPQRSLFKYRLDGYDKDWIDAGNRRTAYYTRLPPGTYTFRAIASNNDGVWNDTGSSYRFTLQPHFYQTVWFFVFCAALVLFLARVWYRWRVRRLRRLAESLGEQVADRTRDLELANKQMREAQDTLVTTARQAGMAEIANNVLHNVGNVLNSVNVSAALIADKLRDSKLAGLAKATNLMGEHAADLGAFITLDERGRALPAYLNKLAAALDEEKQGIAEELQSLTKSVDHIKEIVATQQAYSGATSVTEPVDIKDLLEDALRMNAGSFTHHQIDIIKEFSEVPPVLLDKHLMLQILINLIGNAKHALNRGTQQPHQIKLKLDVVDSPNTPRLRIRIEDNGEGIAPENLTRLFAHGFTTRKNGHGFGLHSCALAVKQMKGSITALSDGPGRGAAFVLELPLTRVAESA